VASYDKLTHISRRFAHIRLRKIVKEAKDDRDRLGMALEKNLARAEEVGVEAEGREEGGGEDMLRAVIRAQHSRIQNLKTKLATAISEGGGGRKPVLSPKMQREHLAMKANRVDFKGQREAAARVEEKRRKEVEKERRRKRELGGEGGGRRGGTGGKVKFDMFGLLE